MAEYDIALVGGGLTGVALAGAAESARQICGSFCPSDGKRLSHLGPHDADC